ncbi:MAG: YhfC family intramembrane metalloprotease [Flavobacteriaceae bacterium]|jgi:hypothetical protein|nr:YhfC family intramembrane metalloprotease [Flavobacteriaceae bacterium]
MEDWLKAMGMIILGIGCFVFMKYIKKDYTKEDRENMDLYEKSVWFGVYFGGVLAILVGILMLLHEMAK